MPEINLQKVQDLFREWKWQRDQREALDAQVRALSPAEREHYYDLIRADSRGYPLRQTRQRRD